MKGAAQMSQQGFPRHPVLALDVQHSFHEPVLRPGPPFHPRRQRQDRKQHSDLQCLVVQLKRDDHNDRSPQAGKRVPSGRAAQPARCAQSPTADNVGEATPVRLENRNPRVVIVDVPFGRPQTWKQKLIQNIRPGIPATGREHLPSILGGADALSRLILR